jgi:hypothetical protein
VLRICALGTHTRLSHASQVHGGLAPHLKALYVAVTRAREDVLILEEGLGDGEARGLPPFAELWDVQGLVTLTAQLDAGVRDRPASGVRRQDPHACSALAPDAARCSTQSRPQPAATWHASPRSYLNVSCVYFNNPLYLMSFNPLYFVSFYPYL